MCHILITGQCIFVSMSNKKISSRLIFLAIGHVCKVSLKTLIFDVRLNWLTGREFVRFVYSWPTSNNSFQLAWPSLSCQTSQTLADFPSLAKSLSQLKQGYYCIHLSVCLCVCLFVCLSVCVSVCLSGKR